MIRVVLPHHLRTLAGVRKEVELEVEGPVTQAAILDALEVRYPTLRGTIRDPATGQRRKTASARTNEGARAIELRTAPSMTIPTMPRIWQARAMISPKGPLSRLPP
jgi:hypothetical protein